LAILVTPPSMMGVIIAYLVLEIRELKAAA
jgi:hypothetical protein